MTQGKNPRRARRLLGATVAGGVALGLLPGMAFATAPEPPPPASTADFCANAPTDNPFVDVVPAETHYENILCLYAAGITTGVTEDTYAPARQVTREQMASFITRLIDAANALEIDELQDLPDTADLPFTDVDPESTHAGNIAVLAEVGIANGVTATTFEPGETVSRGQMASFINRAQAFLTGGTIEDGVITGGEPFVSEENFFLDDEGTTHEANINAIASVGIAVGNGVDTYNPAGAVPRSQMASFLMRHAAVNEAAGVISPLPETTPPTITSATVTANVNNAARLDVGDTLTIGFSEEVTGSRTATYALEAADGTTHGFICNTNGCTYDATTSTLSITVGGTAGTVLPYPVEITAISGVADVAGNAAVITATNDNTFEAPAPL